MQSGWREDACIYRCRATVDEAPVYSEYLSKTAVIRDKYRDLILNGTFRDTDLAKCDTPHLQYQTFENGSNMAVVATQSHKNEVKAAFETPGYEFVEADGIGSFSANASNDGSTKVDVKKDALVVLVYRKK